MFTLTCAADVATMDKLYAEAFGAGALGAHHLRGAASGAGDRSDVRGC